MAATKRQKQRESRVEVEDLKARELASQEQQKIRGGVTVATTPNPPGPIPIPYPNTSTKR